MKRRYAIAGGLLLLIACVLFGALAWMKFNPRETAEAQARAAVLGQGDAAREPERTKAPDVPEDPEETAAQPYKSLIDFDALWEMNPDIYAWLYIPGTEVNYPILQREGDDAFYLRRNSEGKSDQAGAIFTEGTYTKKDFSDPVTMVYGHYMRSGTMFGSLQSTYSAQGGIEGHREVVVYLPERELRYEVFAAVPYGNRHVLYYHDFSDPEVFEAFLEQTLSVRSINASVDGEAEVEAGDQLLILSTCLRGDSHQRYLVLAKRVEKSAAP